MLCGQNPFHKSNIVLTLEAIQRTEPSPPSELDPALAPFDPILAKALAKDRERRYPDASEMQEDLRRIVLPRASERLTGFLARLFRPGVEDGQRAAVDSDSWKITGSRNAPATPPSTSSALAAPGGDSATSPTLLVSYPVGEDPGTRIATPRPSPRPPPPPPRTPAAAETTATEAPPVALQDTIVAAVDVVALEAAPALPAETTDRIRKTAPPAATSRLSGRALWVAFGGGVFASVLLLAALVAWAVVADSPAPRLRRTALAAAALQRHGTLWVDARELAVTKAAGSVQIEDVRLDFSRGRGALDLRVQGPPGSFVFVNGVSRGPSPLAGLKVSAEETLLEVRKQGRSSAPPLRLRYRED